MKKFKLFGMMVVAAMVVSCSSDDVVQQVQEDNAIQFSSYLGNAASRGTVVSTSTLKTGENFGVFAYYIPSGGTVNYTNPDFMYNQKVEYDATANVWKYSPIKYWPNNQGDKIAFVAYAPYDEFKTMTDGLIDWTIDSDIKEQKDLVWNTAGAITIGKQAINDSVRFVFGHALSRVAFSVQAAADQIAAGGTIEDKTTITLKSITIGNATKGFYTDGKLNLANGTWSDQTGNQGFTLSAGSNFITNSNILNPGESAKQILVGGDDEDDYMFVIPQNLASFDVTVVYDVFTDANGDGVVDLNDSKITNTITSTIAANALTLEQGKAYMINLVLGMTEVKLSATISDWGEEIGSTVNVPINTAN